MLGKLLKYDLKYMIKNMSIFYILAIFFAIVTRILKQFEPSVMLTIITNITVGCVWAMIANIVINVMMRSWVRFRDSLYKDESYLTHTLPVTKNDLYNSKFIQTLIFYIVGFVIVLLTLFIAFYSSETWEHIKEYVSAITTGLNLSNAFFISIAIILIFLEIFNAIQCGFLGIIIGHRSNNHKSALSVAVGFVAYLVVQTAVLGLVFAYGFFDPTVMELFKTSTINIDVLAFKRLAIVASIMYVLFITLMYFVNKKILSKGVNIE